MTKKFMIALLAVAIALCPCAALADISSFNAGDFQPGDIDKNPVLELQPSTSTMLGKTTDKVSSDGEMLIVETAEGLLIKAKYSDDAVYITQDILASYEAYSVLPDPQGFMDWLIEVNAHLFIVKIGEPIQLSIRDCGVDTLSTIIGDAATLSDSDVAEVSGILAEAFGCEFSYGMLGDNLWFVGDSMEQLGYIVMYTWVNSHMIYVAADRDVGSENNAIFKLLNNVTISAAQ